MSRASLVQVYLDSLPFCRLAIVQTAGGCRVAVGGETAPGETVAATYYLKPLHVELLLTAAGLTDGPTDQAPDIVAARLEKTARTMHAPYESETELRAVAEKQVDEIQERVRATNQAGGLSALNKAYKQYRAHQIDNAQRAIGYNAYIEQHYTIGIVRSVASVGRMIA